MENGTSDKECEEVQTEAKRVDLDTILVEEIGQIGIYQLKTALLLAIAVTFIGWSGTEFIFTTARIPTRCVIPECEDPLTPAEFAPTWLLNAVPSTNSNSFDNCNRFANTSFFTSDNEANHCPATLFDRQTISACEQHVYANTYSVVYDFKLACDEWRRSMIGALKTIGTLVALPCVGILSDRFGRNTVLIVAGINLAWLGTVRYFANTYTWFTISQFSENAFGSGGFSCAYILLMEVIGTKHRVAGGAILNTSYALGQVLLALIAWALPYWKHLTLAIYIPQFLIISYFWLMTDSARWYMSKGRYDTSEKVLKDMARVNGKKLCEKSLAALRQTAEAEKTKSLEVEVELKDPWLVVLVFRHKPILLRCLVSPVWWITMTFIYYGLSINAVNITGNSYVNFMAVSAVEIPGFWLAVVLMNKAGRKPVLIIAFWVCAACQIGYIYMPHGVYSVALTVYLIGKGSISMVVTSVYVYTAELYPTKYRHRLLAFSSMLGRVGSIVAPLTPAFGDKLPFILFACFALLSGLLVLLTPETLGAKFPDTMEEAEQIGRARDMP